jgi:hypothetical protein
LASAEDSGGIGAAGVQSFSQNDSQVYASNPSSRAVFPLAVVPEAARFDCLGVQQIAERCGWDRVPPRFLVHDRDACFGTSFDRRVRNLGIAQARTPFRSPRANAIAERWVRSVRTECLDQRVHIQ